MGRLAHLKIPAALFILGTILGFFWRTYESYSLTATVSTAQFSEMNLLVERLGLAKPQSEQKKQGFRAVLAATPLEGGVFPMSVFEDNYDIYGPELMIDVLDENPNCHSQAHFLGRTIYSHTKDLASALAICQNKCSSGCVHGALMGMFNAPLSAHDPSLDAMTPQLQQRIADTCKNPEVIKYTGIGNCYHAIGHVLDALVDDDIPTVLDFCRSVFQKDGLAAIYYCATGVYMQEDLTLGEADMKNPTSKFFPCDSNPYPAACYRYKLRRLFTLQEYSQAQTLCLSLVGAQQRGCFHGLGFAFYGMVYKEPASLNQLCRMGDDLDKQMCIEGALGILKVIDRDVGASACQEYKAGSTTMCLIAAERGNFTMKRNFELYTQ